MNRTLVMFALAIPVAILAFKDVFMGAMGMVLLVVAACVLGSFDL